MRESRKNMRNISDNHDGAITHLESDILSVKSSEPEEALLGTKLVEVMEFQLSYFKSLKLCCESVAFNMPPNLENSAGATGPEKFSFQYSNHHTISLISHTSKVMLKILQGRLQQYMSQELPDIQARFRKGRGTRDQIANILWITEQAREF